MASRELYVEKIEAEVRKLASKVEKLRDRAEQGSKDAKLQLDRLTRDLRPRERNVRKQLNEARSVSNDAWHDLKAGVEAAWRDLKGAYERAAKAAKGPEPRKRRPAAARTPRKPRARKTTR